MENFILLCDIMFVSNTSKYFFSYDIDSSDNFTNTSLCSFWDGRSFILNSSHITVTVSIYLFLANHVIIWDEFGLVDTKYLLT